MASDMEMSTPVTRGELKAELDQLRHQIRQEMASKTDLEIWGGALAAQIQASEQRLLIELTRHTQASEQRLRSELARHTQAIRESVQNQTSVIDEKYRDLPARVRRLEAKVFAPKRK